MPPSPRDASASGHRRRDAALFLWKWLQAPLKVGAVWPSGRRLGRALAAEVDLSRPGVVVELGAGTGNVTDALLQAGVPADRLVAVELDPGLAGVLQRRFPQIRVVVGNAGDLSRILRAEGVGRISTVVSCLPLVSLPSSLVRQIVTESFAMLVPDGRLVQFTYGLTSPIPLRHFRPLRLEGRRTRRVWQNVPPASVWTYRRAAAA